MESGERRIGNIYGFTGGNYGGNVYDSAFECPTLTDMQGGGRQPHIVEIKNMKIKIKQATKDGFVECELPGIADLDYVSSTTRRGRVQRGGEDKSYDNDGEYP